LIDNNRVEQSTKDGQVSLEMRRRQLGLEMTTLENDFNLYRSSTSAGGSRKASIAFSIAFTALANGAAFGAPIWQKDLGAFVPGQDGHHSRGGFFSNEIQSSIMDTERADSQANPNTVKKMSMPVSFTVVGCVKNGQFASGPYTFQVESYNDGVRLPASLAPYEGKTIQIDGLLSPGDHLTPHKFAIVDDKCRPDLHSSKFN
jgi:hypothetical protein